MFRLGELDELPSELQTFLRDFVAAEGNTVHR